ncbi:MAG: aquaporin [Micrococcaceae bacterium]
MSNKVVDIDKKQDATPDLKGKLLAEAFGTFLLVFGGLGVGLLASLQEGAMPVSIAFALSLMIGIIAVGHISGGHFNPAVTVGLAVAKRFNTNDILPYIAAQLIGAALAIGVLFTITLNNQLITSDVRSQLFSSLLNQYGDVTRVKFGMGAAFLTETITTLVFVTVILAVTSKKASEVAQRFAPIAIAFALGVMIQVALPITNAALNPARATAAALAAPSGFTQLWLFWLAPILGAAIAGIIFRSIENADDSEDKLVAAEHKFANKIHHKDDQAKAEARKEKKAEERATKSEEVSDKNKAKEANTTDKAKDKLEEAEKNTAEKADTAKDKVTEAKDSKENKDSKEEKLENAKDNAEEVKEKAAEKSESLNKSFKDRIRKIKEDKKDNDKK